jgi:hypothetical protein
VLRLIGAVVSASTTDGAGSTDSGAR